MTGLVDPQLETSRNVPVFVGDIDERTFNRLLRANVISWDIETTGLDWKTDRIATVQVHADGLAAVVRLNGRVPTRIRSLLEDPSLLKVMHHAMFDLRFMVNHWEARPTSVACTKIASKLAHPEAAASAHSLAALVQEYFNVELDKTQRTTDWLAEELDADQLNYVVGDVEHLWPLYERLDSELRRQNLTALRDRCYQHLTTRVELELRGYPDVFTY